MKTFRQLALPTLVALLTLALIIAGMARAQTGTPGDEKAESANNSPTGETLDESSPPAANDPTGVLEDDPQPLTPGAVTIVNDVVQVQGRLTTPAGAPITGSRTLTVAIYDTSSGGVARCGDVDTVPVVDGLFTMSMDSCTADDFNGDVLWMGIKVDPDAEMTPRQEIFAVPYAWALRPGAIVKGADSYVFVPGSSLVKNLSSDTTRWDIQSNSAARIWRGATAGTKIVYFPITLPAVLYGQNVTLEQLTVYYKCNNATNGYIDRTVLNVQTDADSWVNVIDDGTHRISTTPASYTFTLSSNNVISNTQGTLSMFLTLSFANDTDFVDVSSIRLRLGHP
jgi:hypothetical protein